MKTIALYARVAAKQPWQHATIASQITALRQRAEADGHLVFPNDVFTDDGFSGATLVRPALKRLRERVAEERVETIYVHSPDRLTRRYAHLVLLLDEFRSHGAQPMFLIGTSGESAQDEVLVQVPGMTETARSRARSGSSK
jgi:site-specific DNA recombinase